MKRHVFGSFCLNLLVGIVTCWFVGPNSTLVAQQPIDRIAFGSCASQLKPCPIWNEIDRYGAELLILLGDNIYADVVNGQLTPADPERIRQSYETLGRDPGFAKLRESTPIMAVWDDHDFGNNDAGNEWIHKDVSAQIFHDFFRTPADSPLRRQAGLYSAQVFGPVGKRVQVILLDTRYFRSPLQTGSKEQGRGTLSYAASTGSDATILGEAQWAWLEEQLQQPAELRLIGSSIQVLSEEHPYEKWSNFPEERQRLYDLIRRLGCSGVVMLSGDRHLGEISLDTSAVGYPLHDITASGFNQANQQWRPMEQNKHRIAGLQWGDHFGAVEINWDSPDPLISLQLRHDDGAIAVQTQFPLSILNAPSAELPLPEGMLSARQALQVKEGEQVHVQMRVASGRAFNEPLRILLNSEENFRNVENLTVVIQASGAEGPWHGSTVETFLNRTIRVDGVVSVFNGRKQLVVTDPAALQMVRD